MTVKNAGMTVESAGAQSNVKLDSRLRGNDSGECGNESKECGNESGECGNDSLASHPRVSFVIPVKTGIQSNVRLDSRLRGNDSGERGSPE